MSSESSQQMSFLNRMMCISPLQKYLIVISIFTLSFIIFSFYVYQALKFDVLTMEVLNLETKDTTSPNIEKVLELLNEREVEHHFNSGLILAGVLYVFGFALGLLFIKTLSSSLRNISVTSRSIASGNLSSRIPILFLDEVGKASIEFNHMADNLQRIIEQLQRLLMAMKNLSVGDFSTRVHVSDTQDEMAQVSISFNKMAENFEKIIIQLH
ncbi:MAG: HAMP domain-containing protein, partial [Parachlamydiaceae bacterium]|nr:HAMP domain-containing protein [Parachlamydiaceae bacterium]